MRRASKGFTLAELLIALAILGVIATFTIPKVLESSGSSKNTANAKEVAGMISGAMANFKLNSTLATTTTPGALTQYMNYVKLSTLGADNSAAPGTETASAACAAATPCFIVASGALMQYGTNDTFETTDNTSAWYFNVDPDGNKTGAGAATFVQMYNGRFSTYGAAPEAKNANGGITAITTDPSWISSWN